MSEVEVGAIEDGIHAAWAIGKRAGFEHNELFQMHEVVHLMQQAYELGYFLYPDQHDLSSSQWNKTMTEQIVELLTEAFNSQMEETK